MHNPLVSYKDYDFLNILKPVTFKDLFPLHKKFIFLGLLENFLNGIQCNCSVTLIFRSTEVTSQVGFHPISKVQCMAHQGLVSHILRAGKLCFSAVLWCAWM